MRLIELREECLNQRQFLVCFGSRLKSVEKLDECGDFQIICWQLMLIILMDFDGSGSSSSRFFHF